MTTRVVLGVSGGIAAYKACELLRLFTESGHDVTVVPTAAALRFVGAPTWAALSGKPVATDVWTDVHEVPHVRIGQTADLVVVAPATADLLAKAAHGQADDLLTSTLLTARCPVVFAPAMHTEMWEHPATVANVATLRSRGAVVVEPAEGRLTGVDTGKGRLPEPAEIFELAREVLQRSAVTGSVTGITDLGGRHVVVSAGGTREYLDPVRFLGNRSSGLQGIRAGPRCGGPRCAGDAGGRQRDAARPRRRQGGPGRDHRPAARRDGLRRGLRGRRGDGRRPRRLPADRGERGEDQEARRRLGADHRAHAEPRHPGRDRRPPRGHRTGRGRVRRRDRRRHRLGAGPGPGQAGPQGLRPAGRQRRLGRRGLRQCGQPGGHPRRRRVGGRGAARVQVRPGPRRLGPGGGPART